MPGFFIDHDEPVPWRAYPGGHLGELFPTVYTRMQAVLPCPAARLFVAAWTPHGSWLLEYQDERWHARFSAELEAMQFEEHGPLVWYEDRLWLGGAQLLVEEGTTYQRITAGPPGPIVCLAADSTGVLWAGTGTGLWCTEDGRTWSLVDFGELAPQPGVIEALHAEGTGMWVALHAQGTPTTVILHRTAPQASWLPLPPPPKPRLFRAITTLCPGESGTNRIGSRWSGI